MSLNRGAELTVNDRSSTGPLTSSGGLVLIGSGTGSTPGGTLSVNGTGNVTLDSNSDLALSIIRAGTTPAKDYSQLHARGSITLGGAYLDLDGGGPEQQCPKLNRGDVETLLTAAGSIRGTFRTVRNGTTVALLCEGAGAAPTVRIHYTAHSVTATVRRG